MSQKLQKQYVKNLQKKYKIVKEKMIHIILLLNGKPKSFALKEDLYGGWNCNINLIVLYGEEWIDVCGTWGSML